MKNSTTGKWTRKEKDATFYDGPFEFFYLEELYAEGIISKELYDITFEQLATTLKRREELEH